MEAPDCACLDLTNLWYKKTAKLTPTNFGYSSIYIIILLLALINNDELCLQFYLLFYFWLLLTTMNFAYSSTCYFTFGSYLFLQGGGRRYCEGKGGTHCSREGLRVSEKSPVLRTSCRGLSLSLRPSVWAFPISLTISSPLLSNIYGVKCNWPLTVQDLNKVILGLQVFSPFFYYFLG